MELVNSSDALIMSYDAGMGDQVNSAVENIEGFAHSSSVQSWAQVKEATADNLQYYIDELNKTIDEFIASGGDVETQYP